MPPIWEFVPQNVPPKLADAGGLVWKSADSARAVFRGEMKKSGRVWTLPDLFVVPGAGIEPARLAAGDFESGKKSKKIKNLR